MGALRKTFLSNLLLLIGINLLIKPFYLLVVEAGVQERLGPDAYGMYFALLNVSYILNILPDLGITNWNNRHVATEGAVHASQLQKLMRIRILLGLIYLLACTLIGLLMDYENHEIAWLILLAFNQVFSTAVLFLRSYLAGMHAFASDRFISILDRLLLIGMLGSALVLIPRDEVFPIAYFIYSQTIAYGITLLVCLLMVFRMRAKGARQAPLSAETVLASSLPFALLILFSMFSGRIDAIMLERIKGSFDAGIYAMAFRLGDMLTMISYLFAVLLLPMFSRQLAHSEEPRHLFAISFRLLLAGCTWVALISCFQPDAILNMLYNEHISDASNVLPWTIASAAMFSLQYTTGTLLTAGHKMKTLIVIACLSLVVNVYVNVQLIPTKGSVGAAQAAFLTQTFVFLIQSIFIHRFYQVWTKQLISHSMLFLFSGFAGSYFISTLNAPVYQAILYTTLLVIIAGVFTKMLPLGDFKKVLPIANTSSEES